MKYNDTIFALSTILGKAGVAVIRISGPKALEALKMLHVGFECPHRQAVFTRIYSAKAKELLDECLVIYFKAPNSFTGEEVVELHLHGSVAVVNDVLSELSDMQFLRLAEPGEFSKRAFLNNKMDLTRAEGLADLIEAETSVQRKVALRQYGGELENLYETWRNKLIDTAAKLEALIDFPDEDIPISLLEEIESSVKVLKEEISLHLDSARRGFALINGLNIAIIGPTNAGKSSLLNALSKQDAAIVSSLAGTTRDVVKVKMNIGGYPVTLADTAGLRDVPQDEVEQEGMNRSIQQALTSEIVLIVLDSTDYNFAWLNNITLQDNQKALLLCNKIDIMPSKEAWGAIAQEARSIPQLQGLKPIPISAKDNKAVSNLIATIEGVIEEHYSVSVDPILTRLRYKAKLEEVLINLENFDINAPLDIAAEDIRAAISSIGNITGRVDVEDILDVVFSSFCIGK